MMSMYPFKIKGKEQIMNHSDVLSSNPKKSSLVRLYLLFGQNSDFQNSSLKIGGLRPSNAKKRKLRRIIKKCKDEQRLILMSSYMHRSTKRIQLCLYLSENASLLTTIYYPNHFLF